MKSHKLSLFIFRRDLRLHDNSALLAALRHSEFVIPCFIFDDHQIKENAYFTEVGFGFMLQSLADLDRQLNKNNGRLYYFQGTAEKTITTLLKNQPIDAVFFNRDYTPFSIKRDEGIKKITEKMGRKCFIYADALLHEPEDILKSNDLPYTIYTPFMRKSRTLPVLKPLPCRNTNFYQIIIDHSITLNPYLKKQARYATIQGGRTEGKKLLHKISALKNYSENRNYPEKNATSHLSAHHKFGTVSIRESYQAIVDAHGLQSTLINELYWRDFFTHIGFHFPHIFKGAFHQKYNAIAWKDNAAQFKKWCDGKTGFPIVDAGMRELNETGYMHNRVRMITASFLVKDVHIDWRWGERYFAQKLVDYDPAVNNGNWQWVASTGCDSQPYFRIFNPWLQQKRFDKACLYIKKWVSELKTASPRDLHNLSVTSSLTNYPKPMVNHAEAAAVAKNLFKL